MAASRTCGDSRDLGQVRVDDWQARLTTPQLCALWRKSRAGLRSALTPDAVAEVVTARERLLDELERREPQVMAEWLDGGGVEPEGPLDYLLREASPGR